MADLHWWVEHAAADHYRVDQGIASFDVLNHVGQARRFKKRPQRCHEVGVRVLVLALALHPRPSLARWARVDRVHGVRIENREGVSHAHLERVVRLIRDVHSDDLEACAGVSDRRPSGAAEQVEKARPHHVILKAFPQMGHSGLAGSMNQGSPWQ